MYILVNCERDYKDIVSLVKNIIFIIKIVAPVVLIIMGCVDFALATMAKDVQDMDKAKKKFITRIIMACAVFMLLSFMELINNILIAVGVQSEWLACWGLQ